MMADNEDAIPGDTVAPAPVEEAVVVEEPLPETEKETPVDKIETKEGAAENAEEDKAGADVVSLDSFRKKN